MSNIQQAIIHALRVPMKRKGGRSTPFPFLAALGILVKELFRALFRHGLHFSSSPAQGKPLFFFGTLNQYKALEPVFERREEAIGLYNPKMISLSSGKSSPYPLTWFQLLSLPALFYVPLLKPSLTGRVEVPKRKKTGFYLIAGQTMAACWLGVRLLRRTAPDILVQSNDHSVINTGLLFAAKKLGIKSVYIQHASVIGAFPPLRFDYAFLDGRAALDSYTSAGPVQSRVFLTGIMKADRYIRKNRPAAPPKVTGICLNQLDDLSRFQRLTGILSEQDKVEEIRVRPHPLLKIRESDFSLSRKVKFSDPLEESIFEFLDGLDLLIAGDSNVHLEAVLMNTPSVYFSSNPSYDDLYGFLEAGLIISKIEQPEEILACLEQPEGTSSITDRAKYYCDTIGTSYEGRSTELVHDLLRQIVHENGRGGERVRG